MIWFLSAQLGHLFLSWGPAGVRSAVLAVGVRPVLFLVLEEPLLVFGLECVLPCGFLLHGWCHVKVVSFWSYFVECFYKSVELCQVLFCINWAWSRGNFLHPWCDLSDIQNRCSFTAQPLQWLTSYSYTFTHCAPLNIHYALLNALVTVLVSEITEEAKGTVTNHHYNSTCSVSAHTFAFVKTSIPPYSVDPLPASFHWTLQGSLSIPCFPCWVGLVVTDQLGSVWEGLNLFLHSWRV